jgi:hypothetical protein
VNDEVDHFSPVERMSRAGRTGFPTGPINYGRHGYDPLMIGIGKATGAVEQSANAVTALANSARDEISGLSEQFRSGARIAPYVIVGTAIVALVALAVALVAVSRRD